nr:tetratricopeptide repeat protein 37 [Onthophagus taurus]
MSSKKILKEAREAINNKDYQNCVKLCKEILSEDRNNYMALVFFGISLQEVGPIEQAQNAFKKAIQLNNSNWIAYNGLASLYEKHGNEEEKKELFKIYQIIIKLDCNEKRIVECAGKILKFCNEKPEILVKYIEELIDSNSVTESGKNNIRMSLYNYLKLIQDLPENLISCFKNLLILLINNSELNSCEIHETYTKLLFKSREYNTSLEESLKTYNLYDNKKEIILRICKAANKLFFTNDELLKNHFNEFKEIIEKDHLIEEFKTNHDFLLSRAIFSFINKNFQETKYLLEEIINLKSNPCVDVYLLKSKTESELSLNIDALSSILKNPDLKISLIRCYINLNEIETAETLLNQITSFKNESERNLLEAQILKSKGKFSEALEVLENQKENDWKSTLEIGNINWELECFDKALLNYLKAAKLNQMAYQVFLKLGIYYKKFNNLDKARRCFEKVIKVHNRCLIGIIELNKIYKIQRNWNGCVNVLEIFVRDKINQSNLWAWTELGLAYHERGDYSKAIDTLRLVIRLNPNNSSCWESLGDTYLARGAYTSALKSYQKSLELVPGNLYPQIQIASIQQILGLFKEAKEQYQGVLFNNKQYIPALKGLAETYLGEAKEFNRNQLWGLARDSAQLALDTLSSGINQNNKLSCFWKLLGDCCFLVAHLSEHYSCLRVQEHLLQDKFVNEPSKGKYIERDDIFEFAIRCFSKAIVCIDNNILIWHDLANCLLSYAKIADDPDKSKDLFNKAFAAIHHCIITNPGNWAHWNLMGVLAFFKEPKSYSLSQHSFIKATILDKNCAVAWCNLSTLYLHLNEIKLANDAFSQAQRCDPNYINSWIGQALIAEFLGHEDCMDLFRHSTQLGCHEQSEIGYGYWVCKTLLGEQTKEAQYAIRNMHAVPVACDSLTWYTELHPDDPCGWNMLGLLRERMGFKTTALKCFKHSLVLIKNDEDKDKILVNYGRLLIENQQYKEAVRILKGVKTATFKSGSSLALALFKNKEYEESYGSYESALHWLTDNNKLQSDLLVALASMAYLFEGHEAAKTLLFQSVKLKPPSPWGFYSMLSIGLLHQDLHLSQLVLNEMSIIKDQKESLNHYSTLISYFYLLKGESKQAIREVSKLLHRYPNEASLWLSLSILLIRLHKERPRDFAASQCAKIATELGQTNMDVTKILCLVSLSLILSGSYKKALKAAQKAVHFYPNAVECWAVLISSLRTLKKEMKNKGKIVTDIVGHIKKLGCKDELLSWLSKQYV